VNGLSAWVHVVRASASCVVRMALKCGLCCVAVIGAFVEVARVVVARETKRGLSVGVVLRVGASGASSNGLRLAGDGRKSS